MKKLFTASVLLIGQFAQSGDIVPLPELLFVGSGSGQCSYTSIQEAIDDAPFGSEIRITKELVSYNENLYITKNLTLKGGYSSCGLAQLNSRAEDSKSVVDAGGNGAGLVVAGDDLSVDITGLHFKNGQSGGFIPAGGITFSGEFGDFNLNHVYVSNSNGFLGGGIYFGADGILNLNDTEVFLNEAEKGGGLYCSLSAEVNLNEGSNIFNNSAENGGGIFADNCDIFLKAGSPVDESLTESGVSFNSATDNGGGIYMIASYLGFETPENNPALGPTRLSNNIANTNQDTVGDGGAIYAVSGSEIVLAFSYFLENSVLDGNGGAIFLDDSVIKDGISETCLFYSDECVKFENNSAIQSDTEGEYFGGAIYANNNSEIGSNTRPLRAHFQGNKADQASAVSINFESLAIIQNSYFIENGDSGSGATNDASVVKVSGVGSEALISFSTFARNKTEVVFAHDNGLTDVFGSIIYDTSNQNAVVDDASNDVSLNCTMVHEGSSLVGGNNLVLLSDDPKFINPELGNYRLQPQSLAIDLCDDSISVSIKGDRDGDARGADFINPNIGSGDFDAGADEYNDVIFKTGFEPGATAWGF